MSVGEWTRLHGGGRDGHQLADVVSISFSPPTHTSCSFECRAERLKASCALVYIPCTRRAPCLQLCGRQRTGSAQAGWHTTFTTGTALGSAHQHSWTSVAGACGLISSFAELEKRRIKNRCKQTRKQAARQLASPSPSGLREVFLKTKPLPYNPLILRAILRKQVRTTCVLRLWVQITSQSDIK